MATPLRPRLSALPTELRRLLSTTVIRQHSTTTSSVSSTEVSHFSALASSWWDPHGPSRILHLMNPLRHQFITRCRSGAPPPPVPGANSPARTLTYLDVGCGGGIFAESAARLPTTASVTAIDPTPDVIKVAKTHLRRDPALVDSGRLRYLNTSVEDLGTSAAPTEVSTTAQGRSDGTVSGGAAAAATAPPASFDVVSVFEVIEHVNSPHLFLEQCMARVKPGGWLIGSTIARTWTSWFTTKLMAEDVMRVVPRGTHDWDKYINADQLRRWVAKREDWGEWSVMGVMYVPGLGWREVQKGEEWGNYFFGFKRLR